MVDKEIILKRTNILEPIYKRLDSLKDGYRQNIALIGQPGVGKTTILKYLSNTFKRPNLIFAYVNLECADFKYFAYKLLGMILYNYLSEKGLIIKDDFSYLVKAAEQSLPNTSAAMKLTIQLIEKDKINDACQKTLDCIDIFTQESAYQLVLIIDEFHFLEEIGIKNVFSILGKKIMLQKSVIFIIASSNKERARKIISEKLSLLFGNFEIINATPLEHKTCKEFILNILYPFLVSEMHLDFLIDLTGGFPFYLKIISKELLRLAEKNSNPQIDSYAIAVAIYNLLAKENGLLNEKFNGIIERLGKIKSEQNKNSFTSASEILISLANGYNTASVVATNIHRNKIQIKSKLNKFAENGLINKNGSFLKISDPLLEVWLKLVFSKKMQRLSEDDSDVKNQFVNQINKMIDLFIFESKRKFLERITEVFNQFEDESIVFDRQRFKLTKFKELKLITFEGARIKEGLYGESCDDIWIAALMPQTLKESDVSEFIGECKKIRQKRFKKILFTFSEPELNASLLAKEEKIHTWNLEYINTLLSLFGKPKIIHY
ncbi:MAG: ATP-binding protein [Candidatus Omnitrophota bacterium]